MQTYKHGINQDKEDFHCPQILILPPFSLSLSLTELRLSVPELPRNWAIEFIVDFFSLFGGEEVVLGLGFMLGSLPWDYSW